MCELSNTSFVNVLRLNAAKHNTETVIADTTVITVRENAFFLTRYIIGDVNITSVTLTVPFLNRCIALNINETVLLKKNMILLQLKIK